VQESGAYALRFFKNGEERVVVVDDVFPCVEDGGQPTVSAPSRRSEPPALSPLTRARTRAQPAFSRSRQAGELWMMLIEKAYAKLHRVRLRANPVCALIWCAR
jgi:hypothetical protein